MNHPSTPQVPGQPGQAGIHAKPPSAHVGDQQAGRIPAELRALPRWVVWSWVWRPDKNGGQGGWDKPPVDPHTGRPTDATDEASWMSFERARALAREIGDGIGVALGPLKDRDGDDQFAGADLDKVIDDRGEVAPWAQSVVARLASYTEETPSGHGLRVWVKGRLPRDGAGQTRNRTSQHPGLEFYDSARYFTVTGRHHAGTPATIEARTAELAELHAAIFGVRTEGRPEPKGAEASHLDDDEALLAKARAARNGAKFAAIFDRGNTSEYGDDDSAADQALCNILSFWTGGDAERIDKLFRLSALMRPKWDRADYRERTIAKAMERGEFYNPSPSPRGGPAQPSANGARDHHGPEGEGIAAATAASDGRNQAEPGPIGPNEAEDDPHRLARLYRDTRCTQDQMVTTRYWRGEWHRWTGGAYHPVNDRELKAELTGSIKAEFDQLNCAALETHGERGSSLKAHAERGSDRDGPPTTRKVTTALVNNAVQALAGYTLLDSRVGQPAWLDLDGPAPFPATEVLPARNRLVHLPSLVEGREQDAIRPTSPSYFGSYALDYDFDLAAPEPVNWLTFLGARPVTGESKVQLQLWPDDPQSIATLQEWFGYHLTPDTSLQKIGTLIGPKRSGKGTIGRILAAMIGPENVAGPTLSGLTTNFGLAPLIGKPCAIISDARLSGRTDAAVVVERLLAISGEDALTIDRKHLPGWTGKLPTRFTLISNELPRVSDPSGALAGRLIILRLTRSFYGREMHELTDLLKQDLPGILLWAIEGWRRLRERGYFRQPDSGRELVEQMENLASPHHEFVQDRCVLGPGREVMAARLYESWTWWCQEKGRDHPGTEQEFGRNLRAVLPTLTTHQRRQADGSRKWFYEGVGLADGPSF